MSEIISLHIGQAGCQIGQSNYDLLAFEHGLTLNGLLEDKENLKSSVPAFFYETSNEKYRPRSIFIDSEPETINNLKTSAQKDFHDPTSIIFQSEDTGNNFSRSKYVLGQTFLEPTLEKIRNEIEKCANFQGFLIYNSVGGGMGSGFTSFLIENLAIEYEKKIRFGCGVYPKADFSKIIVEPYNVILATSSLIDQINFELVLDNEAIHEICEQKLEIESPSELNLNRLISQLVSGVTSSIRYSGSILQDLNDFPVSLVPYPKFQFCGAGMAPLIGSNKYYFENLSVAETTFNCLEKDSTLVKLNVDKGKYLAMSMLYRGDVVPRDVSATIGTIKARKNIQFADWVSTGFKIGINSAPFKVLPYGDLALSKIGAYTIFNNTSMKEIFKRINTNYKRLYSKQAFVHWYFSNGLEKEEFEEAEENLRIMMSDYDEAEADLEQEVESQEQA